MKVVGIDIAPSKNSHVFDGEKLCKMGAIALDQYLTELPGDVLIAWDAPLTGPPDPDTWADGEKNLYTRKIEKFFQRKGDKEYEAPEGISVLSYAGCSHWAISRRLLGLPRVGHYDEKTKLPFRLVTNDEERPSKGRHVVEVHPAVAIWRWCELEGYSGPLQYKKGRNTKAADVEENRKALIKHLPPKIRETLIKLPDSETVSDDDLDAVVSWYLARCWLDGNRVMLLGNSKTGSFLLPEDDALRTAFDRF